MRPFHLFQIFPKFYTKKQLLSNIRCKSLWKNVRLYLNILLTSRPIQFCFVWTIPFELLFLFLFLVGAYQYGFMNNFCLPYFWKNPKLYNDRIKKRLNMHWMNPILHYIWEIYAYSDSTHDVDHVDEKNYTTLRFLFFSVLYKQRNGRRYVS